MIKKLTGEQRTSVMRSHKLLVKALEWVEEAEKILHESFAKAKEKDVLQASFDPRKGEAGAVFLTPFGSGRTVSVGAIIDGTVVIRYIFEKEATNELGMVVHVPIGELRFDQDGVITAVDGTKLANLNSLQEGESYTAIVEIGLAVIHACAVDGHYAVVTEP